MWEVTCLSVSVASSGTTIELKIGSTLEGCIDVDHVASDEIEHDPRDD